MFDEVGEGSEWVQLGDEQISVRGYLGRFLFTGERVNSKIRLLSGGERSRVIIAKILKRGGNVIVLDEPTNDLDLATLRVLEEALVGFGGVVVAVSHDRYFLNRVCTSVLAFEGGGQLYYDVGNYDDYVAKRAAHKADAARWAAEAAQLKTQAATATATAETGGGAQTLLQGNARTRRHRGGHRRGGGGSRAGGNVVGLAGFLQGPRRTLAGNGNPTRQGEAGGRAVVCALGGIGTVARSGHASGVVSQGFVRELALPPQAFQNKVGMALRSRPWLP